VPDIFLSYSREDQGIAQQFAQGFARHGLDVWWDTTLRAGDAYDEVTERALRAARAVVVLWSPRSVGSRWVRAEATIAARQKTLVPCTIEPCERPIMFELTQTADLSRWDGDDDDTAWRSFLDGLLRFMTVSLPAAATAVATAPAPQGAAHVTKLAPQGAAHTTKPAPQGVAEPTTQALAGAAPPDQTALPERRHLTVLAARLARANTTDPEEWHAITTAFQAAAAPIITRFGGTARWRGDALTALFGYPIAHEDAAERAVHAGLALAADQAAKVAIDAGILLIAPGTNGEVELFGDAPEIAAAACAEAPAGAIVVTAIVHALIAADFDTEPAGALVRVLRPAAHAPLARTGTRFVGREDEAYLLNSRWRRVLEGDGQYLLIKGEPGIGKTRLTQEFGARIAAEPHHWIDLAGASLFANTPFHALIQSLARHLEACGGDRYAALTALLAPHNLSAETAPLLAEMLGIALPLGQLPPSLAPAEHRRRLLSALAEWVFALTRDLPVVIAIDDLQWIDPSTLEFVQILVEQGATAPLMLIGTARPEFRPPWPERAHHAQIMLGRLNDRQICELVRETSTGLDTAVIEAVMKRADGVPLFAEELTRLLANDGAYATPAMLGDIPATLRDSLSARLDRLGPARDIAQRAAVIGREFSYALLRAVAETDDETLTASLAVLADAELIHARGTPPRATYQFRHALLHDSAYEALTRVRRRTLHAQIAATITAHFPELAAASPELLASHWSRAGKTAPAVAAWHAAGTAAYTRRAFKEAVAHYREALTVLATSPDSPARDAQELELASALNHVLELTLGYAAPETLAATAHTHALAEKRGSLAHLNRESVRAWRGVMTSGDYAAAATLAARIFDPKPDEADTPGHRINACSAQMQVRFYTGDLAGVERYYESLAPLIASVGDTQEPGINILGIGIASICALARGATAAAAARMADVRAYAQQRNNPYDHAMALHFEANLAILEGDAEVAQASAARLVDLADANGFTYLASLARGSLGWAAAMDGHREGLTAMRAAIADMVRSGARIALVLSLTRLAEGQAFLGDTAAALTSIAEALAANPQEAIYRPNALLLRSRLRQRAGDTQGASSDACEAMALSEAMGALAYRDKAAQLLATLG
jgi:tetratricopeptide (TPR) repeat protein